MIRSERARNARLASIHTRLAERAGSEASGSRGAAHRGGLGTKPTSGCDSAGIPEYVTEGQQPAISYDGRWLAFVRQDRGQREVLLSRDGAAPAAARGRQDLGDVLEMTVTAQGDIIAAVGGAANPHLAFLHSTSGDGRPLGEIAGSVRYPAISPDSKLLAFSRRDSGSWHLFVRQIATGSEQQLTGSACNATSPAWKNSHTLLYATDCGRGLGLSAVARIDLNR